MRGGLTRPVVANPYALIALLLMLLSGCSLFRPAPPPAAEAPPAASEPEAASAPEVATPPEAASAPGEAEAKPSPARRPRPAPVRRRPPAPPPPPPPPPPPVPAPAPLVAIRTIERGTFRTLLDSDVQKSDGKIVGRAIGLIAGPNGKPVDIIVNLQGFMGIGDREASFPWSTVRVNMQPKSTPITLVLGPGQQPTRDRPKPGAGPAPTDPTPTRLPILDASIERPNGAKVGRVVDVLLGRDADPLAVVVDVSGTLQERHAIAAEWSALRFVTKDNELRAQLDLSDKQVDASPPYVVSQAARVVSPVATSATTATSAPAASASAASSHGAQ